MSKNKKKNQKKRNVFNSDLNYNSGSNKVSKRMRKQLGGLTQVELSNLVSKIHPNTNAVTILHSKTV